jgi:hypothetical protein
VDEKAMLKRLQQEVGKLKKQLQSMKETAAETEEMKLLMDEKQRVFILDLYEF